MVLPSAPAQADESKSEIVVSVGSIRETIVDDVRRLLAPMFMLFDFREFNEGIYRDIVTRFVNGQST